MFEGILWRLHDEYFLVNNTFCHSKWFPCVIYFLFKFSEFRGLVMPYKFLEAEENPDKFKFMPEQLNVTPQYCLANKSR